MAIVEVYGKDHRQLQSIADRIASAKKIVVFTGAGISTNCGIPVGQLLQNAPKLSDIPVGLPL